MRAAALFLVAFVAMEPVTYAAHRWVMHGVGMRWHASHHRSRPGSFEANDRFPVVFALLVGAMLVVGFNLDGWSWLVPVGFGVTAYGMVYGFVHDLYIHRRFGVLGSRRVAGLERLAAAHRVHHRTGGEPYGMLVPRGARQARSGSRPSQVPADA
jgi:beta-carotene 3-hydroxylase